MTARSVQRWVTSTSAALLAIAAPVIAAAMPAKPEDDIRDIRPLISIPPWWYWLAAGLAAASILALISGGIRYWQRRRERALSPEQRAMQALTEADALARDGQCREWAELVAQTLRTALARRLDQEACPETTSELAAMDWPTIPRANTVDGPRLVELLTTCDLTRFALGRLDTSALLAETQLARDWVTRLFAAPEPEKAATPMATQSTPTKATP